LLEKICVDLLAVAVAVEEEHLLRYRFVAVVAVVFLLFLLRHSSFVQVTMRGLPE
jgi:hypothetical protein